MKKHLVNFSIIYTIINLFSLAIVMLYKIYKNINIFSLPLFKSNISLAIYITIALMIFYSNKTNDFIRSVSSLIVLTIGSYLSTLYLNRQFEIYTSSVLIGMTIILIIFSINIAVRNRLAKQEEDAMNDLISQIHK